MVTRGPERKVCRMHGLDRAKAPDAGKAKSMLDEVGGSWWNVYIGGPRSAGSGWTPAVMQSYAAAGITRFLLTYVGQQDKDVSRLTDARGEVDGRDAVSIAAEFGFGAGTPVCLDVEGRTFNASPGGSVAYAAGWSRAVRAAGLRPGVYSNPRMFVPLADSADKPDWIWIAHWKRHDVNPNADPHNGPGVAAGLWGDVGQRAWQYAGAFDDLPCQVGGLNVDISVADEAVLTGAGSGTGSQGGRAHTTPGGRPFLRNGDRGDDVKRLQDLLIVQGHGFGIRVPVDGVFGDITEERVKDFQRERGLVDDGKVGDATWEALGG